MERNRDYQDTQVNRRSNMGLRLAAAGALLVGGVAASCSDRDESMATMVPTPETTTMLTLEDMGADAGVTPTPTVLVPKVFSCGIECLSPEDAAKLGITWVDGQPVRKAPLPPACGCGGPHPHESETSEVPLQ
jgi:hypothetical protein